MRLVRPALDHLDSYVDALRRGYSPDNLRGEAAAQEDLAFIACDAAGFLASLDDREARGAPITLPDGSRVVRLPGFHRWMWDGEFAGSIGIRWQPGTSALTASCPGHIGYSVVPWKQRRGYAKSALATMLGEARAIGLAYVDITTEPENIASRKVIEAHGGQLVERFLRPASLNDDETLRYRVHL
jgi:predicted acetyltransferase